MQTKMIKNFDTPLSAVCLGTAGMGADVPGSENHRLSMEILDRYYAMGGRFLDTANVYGAWGKCGTNASERFIGAWMRSRGVTDMVVTSKCCHYSPAAPTVSRVNRECALADLEESRAGLGLDTLDIYLLHRDNTEKDIRTIVDFCVEMKDSGKIRRFGFSNYTKDRVEAAVQYLGKDWRQYFIGVSNEWSLAMEGVPGYETFNGIVATDAAMTAYCRDTELPLFPFSAAAKGFFTKLQRCGAVYDENGFTHTESFTGRQDWLTDVNGRAYNILCGWSAQTGISAGMLSVAYLIRKEHPVIPAVSVSNPSQLEEFSKITEAIDLPWSKLSVWG